MSRYKIEIDCAEPYKLVEALEALVPLVTVVSHKPFSPATEEEIELARKKYQESEYPDVEIDDDAGTSEGDEGTWVQAWVWLSNEDLGREEDEEEPVWEAGYDD